MKMKYAWTNEVDCVFAKKGSRVEFPYVGPSLEMSYATSMIPKSRVYEMYLYIKHESNEINGMINREFLMKDNDYIV